MEKAIVSGLDQIAEEKIRKAMDAGEFDQLPGKGKPLQLEENPFEPAGWGVAFHLLKKNGFTLPWIEEGMEIERKRLLARRDLCKACQAADEGEVSPAEELFASRIQALNREILQYNLRVPGMVFQRGPLDLEKERAAALGEVFSPRAAESQLQE